MAEKAVGLEEAISLALSLSPVERLKLVERIVSSVENDISAGEQSNLDSGSGPWGAEVMALLGKLDLSEWEQMDIPDVGEWVHQLRRQESGHNWTDNE